MSNGSGPAPNPDPSRYEVLDTEKYGNYSVLKIKYLDCTNYEGVKILVFNVDFSKLMKQKRLDPHFSDDKTLHSPIARFAPTDEGWEDAKNYAMYCYAKDLSLSGGAKQMGEAGQKILSLFRKAKKFFEEK